MNGSLDTNIILRYLIQDVPSQYEAAERLLGVPGRKYVLSDTAIVEIAFVMQREYGMSREDIADILGDVMNLSTISCRKRFFDRVFVLFVAHPALSMEDCCVAVQAKEADAVSLYTFDKKLVRQVPYAKLLV